MPFDRPTLDTIHQRIIAGIETRLTGGTALLRRAILRILAKVFAGSLHLLYGYVEWISKQIFVDQAEGDMLDRHGLIWGITRKAASFASGSVIFYGVNTTLVPEGTVVQDENGIEFATIADGTISGGQATIDIQAVEAGEDSNYSGSSLQLVEPIDDINDLVDVVAPGTTGGVDEESDDDYRARILYRIQQPPMGGNADDYVAWALSDEISTDFGIVAGAWCFPLASGPGTVDVVVTAQGSNPVASSGLLAVVQSYIDSVKPVTADVTVQPVTKKEVELWISITPNTTVLTSRINENMEDAFENLAAPGEDFLISRIRDAIMDAGVDDYDITSIEVDGTPVSVDDVSMSNYDYPVLLNINFATL